MRCTECLEEIPFYAEDITVRVVYSDGRGIEKHCHHTMFDESDPAIIAVLGSQDCLLRWLNGRAQTVQAERAGSND
jgi:hypothetical protein